VDIDVQSARPTWGDETEATEVARDKAAYVGCQSTSPAMAADPRYEMRIDIDNSNAVPAGMYLAMLSLGNTTRVELRWTPMVSQVVTDCR
jgi:hypothetical protein